MADICAVKIKRPHLTKEERFPRCYKDVSKVLKTVKSCRGNLKTVLYNSKLRGAYLKKVQGLASNILKNYRTVSRVIERVDLSKKEPLLQLECLEVMVYELILGTGTLVGRSKPIEAMGKYRPDILNAFQAVESESASDSGPSPLPRYARVNTLVATVDEVSGELHRLGYEEVRYEDGLSQERYLELIRGLRSPQFLVDCHFSDMLVFPDGENLCRLKMYQKGKILLQDKSSYIPVRALDPDPGSVVLDACAAPGMKTIHIASVMQNQGVLLAYEKDAERFATLQKMIYQYNIQTCETFNQDFKSTDPTDDRHSKVRYILLDPSCSGSGMVNRMDSATDRPDSKSESRLQKLAGFQIVLLKHALKFPNVQRVVYSTCSIHEEENEFVVHEALGAFRDQFRLVPVMPEWPTRGSDRYEFGELCLRSYPEENATNGFFVAAFQRVDPSEEHSAEHPKKKRNKKHRSEIREDEKEPNWMDGVSDSEYRDNGICGNTHKSHKRKKHDTAEHNDREDMPNYLKPEAPDCDDEEFPKSKRTKKKRRSESRVEENEQNSMNCVSNYGDNGDERHKSGKGKKHKKAEQENEDMQNTLEPGALDCEDKELPNSKRNKKKHRSEIKADGNEYSCTTEKEMVSNCSHEDDDIDDNCCKNQKRKKHKKNRHEREGEDYELSGCDREETSLSMKKEKPRSDLDGKGNLEGNTSSGTTFESDHTEEVHCRKKKKKFTEITQSQTECPDAEHSVRKKKKKHKTKHDGRESPTRNDPADSETSTLERIHDAERLDSVEKHEVRHAENYEQRQFMDESVACTVGNSKKKKKRKKHEAETDESIVYQENQSGDVGVEEIPPFKKHKKHKKEKRSYSPKLDE